MQEREDVGYSCVKFTHFTNPALNRYDLLNGCYLIDSK